MHDPHVVALHYRIEHDNSVDYRNAKPFVHEEPKFRLEVREEKARFDLKIHCATEGDARKFIEAYISVWEFEASLNHGPNYFRLKFDRAEIEDRNPAPGPIKLSVTARAGAPTARGNLTVVPPDYPQPPSGLALDPNVRTMHGRYMGYRSDHELLAAMAYFCLTVLEDSVLEKSKRKRRSSPRRRKAARYYRIEGQVLDKIGELSSSKGGAKARKADGIDEEMTSQECRFLEDATKAIIRRAAEKVCNSANDLPEILLSDFPMPDISASSI